MSASVSFAASSTVLPFASSTTRLHVAVPKPQPVVKYEISSITAPGPTFRKKLYMSPHESLKYSPDAVGFSIAEPDPLFDQLLKFRKVHSLGAPPQAARPPSRAWGPRTTRSL